MKQLTDELSDRELEALHGHLVNAMESLMGDKELIDIYTEYDQTEVYITFSLMNFSNHVLSLLSKRYKERTSK